jgi:hypothetical protein
MYEKTRTIIDAGSKPKLIELKISNEQNLYIVILLGTFIHTHMVVNYFSHSLESPPD